MNTILQILQSFNTILLFLKSLNTILQFLSLKGVYLFFDSLKNRVSKTLLQKDTSFHFFKIVIMKHMIASQKLNQKKC